MEPGNPEPGSSGAMGLKVAFIGLNDVGCCMAVNLVKAGCIVTATDRMRDAASRALQHRCTPAISPAKAVADADVVITLLAKGRLVKAAYEEIIGNAPLGALLIDCSSIEPEYSRQIADRARAAGYEMIDAPVFGGKDAALARSLICSVGGSDRAFARAIPVLQTFSDQINHAGESGAGQWTKAWSAARSSHRARIRNMVPRMAAEWAARPAGR